MIPVDILRNHLPRETGYKMEHFFFFLCQDYVTLISSPGENMRVRVFAEESESHKAWGSPGRGPSVSLVELLVPLQSGSVSKDCSLRPPPASLVVLGVGGQGGVTKDSCFRGWEDPVPCPGLVPHRGQDRDQFENRERERESFAEAALCWTLALQGAPALT